MRPLLPFALALAAALSAPPAWAETDPSKISSMADELQRIQVRIAHGDKTALSEQLAQLKAIGEAIAAAKPVTWAGKREADSLVVYVLSGGSLVDIVPLIRNDALVESERALVRGAVAYITSHEADALEAWSKIDLGTLDVRLAGQVAFARSVLENRRDPKAAALLLDWARLLAPGGLVEEAALRREAPLLVEAGDVARVAILARQYATRFATSPYAAGFFRELARLIGQVGLADDPANYRLLSDATSTLPTESRRNFMLTLAKAAIVNGQMAAAAAAAAEALPSARANSSDDARSRLYLDAARIFSDAYDGAAMDLQGVPVAKLDSSDAALLAVVRRAAAQLRAVPSAAAVEAQGAPSGDAKAEGAALTIDEADAALKRTASIAAGFGGAP